MEGSITYATSWVIIACSLLVLPCYRN